VLDRQRAALGKDPALVAAHVASVVGEADLLGRRARVHHDQSGAGGATQVCDPRIGEAARVVDQVRARLEHPLGDTGLPRVDRDRDALGGQCAHQRHHPLRLDLLGADVAVGHPALAADVDDRRAIGDERPCAGELLVQRIEPDGVGERVRIGVDDPHQRRPAGGVFERAVAQPQRGHRLTRIECADSRRAPA
jgi:hypothetical protein